MTTLLRAVPLLLLVALAAYAARTGWDAAGDAEIGPHGLLALLIGVVGTLVLAVGLVLLLFHSRRHGYDRRWPPDDDEAGEDPPPR